jgi:hypothetical protein
MDEFFSPAAIVGAIWFFLGPIARPHLLARSWHVDGGTVARPAGRGDSREPAFDSRPALGGRGRWHCGGRRLLYDPRIVGGELGTAPVFNWLLFGYGAPAIAFGIAGRAVRLARGEDTPVRIAQALSLMCSALLVFFEIHALNSGDPYARNSGLIE